MKFRSKLAFGLGMLLTSTASLANSGEEVNCSQVWAGSTAMYAGWASCFTSDRIELSQLFWETSYESQTISKLVNGVVKSCSANVPYSRTVDHYNKVCDYKPVARITITEGLMNARVFISASDADGTVTGKEAWIDGESVDFGSHMLYGPGSTYTIKATATDNDGYSHTTYQVVKIKGFYEFCQLYPQRCP